MNLDQIAHILGWLALMNIAVMAIALIGLKLMRRWNTKITQLFFDIDASELQKLQYQWLGHYKLFTLFFCILPYFAIKLAM